MIFLLLLLPRVLKRSEINAEFRDYVKDELKLLDSEVKLVSKVYESLRDILGENFCLQIGSYARGTAISPIKDLDILYILGEWNENDHAPSEALNRLHQLLDSEYKNPTDYKYNISPQTHSITIEFESKGEVVFSVDVVPAYIDGENEFSQDKYRVPEIQGKNKTARRKIYESIELGEKEMGWKKSDPRGYAKVCQEADETNPDYRPAIKLIKAWNQKCKKVEEETYKLKSFHIEQIVNEIFNNNEDIDIYGIIFDFMKNLKYTLKEPKYPDRADSTVFVDEYVTKPDFDLEIIINARDAFMMKLENVDTLDSVGELFEEPLFYKRPISESFLFDYNIPVFLVDNALEIQAFLEKPRNGFSRPYTFPLGLLKEPLKTSEDIMFLSKYDGVVDLYKWKVKNDYGAEPRGEITDHHTKNMEETTRYLGNHYVECYAIKEGFCISKKRLYVRVSSK